MSAANSIVSGRSDLLIGAVRRRLWRLLFAPAQRRLGSFFLDARDHIGSERLVTGNWYEATNLRALDSLIARLGLGKGVALDGGANIGNHSCWLARRVGHVVSVEPGRVASLVLEANLLASGETNWEVVRCALGDRTGKGSLRTVSDTNIGSNRVRAADSDGEGEFDISTGDDVLARRARTDLPVTVIKLDIEGAEAVALAGLHETLVKDHPLLCLEVLDAAEWPFLRGFLTERGYTDFLYVEPFGRVRRLISGDSPRLRPLPHPLPPGGADMVFCLTTDQASRLKSGSRVGSP